MTIPSQEEFYKELEHGMTAYKIKPKFHKLAEGTGIGRFTELIKNGEWLKK